MSEYRRGWDDHAASLRAQAEALAGPDRTLYECIGGPRHGERVETGGGLMFFVPVFRPVTVSYSYNLETFGLSGEYRREEIAGRGRRRVVYVWQGER